MTTLLHIDSSARVTRSHTRRLTQMFVDRWLEHDTHCKVLCRDVGLTPPPPVTEEWIAACFKAPEERSEEMKAQLSTSDELIIEIVESDVIVLGVPMYNYGMPASLKAWVDQVIRIDKTFTFDLARGDFPLQPVLSGKTLVAISSRGEFGYEPGGVRGSWNHLDGHIRTIATFLGVAAANIHQIAIEFQEFKDDRHARSVKNAEFAVIDLCDTLAVRA